jgi:hypothetical protein
VNGMKNSSTKYMELFQTIGYFIGFPILIYYSLFNHNFILVLIGVVIIIASRFIGYGVDKINEKKHK